MTSGAVGTTDLPSQPIYGGEDGWCKLLEQVSSGSIPPEEAVSLARRGHEDHVDPRWVLPLAMAHWMERRYSDAFVCLVEPLVVHACDHLWIYHNLLGMVARQLPCELARAVAAFERSIELEPNRPDTLYNYANLLKDDEPERAVVFYRRSLSLQPDAAAAWHNYGSTLTNLTHYHDALAALRLSLRLDPLDSDVWCNLGWRILVLEEFNSAELAFRYATP